MKNIFAYTETEYESYPGYVSYNRQDDGAMTLTVRGKNSSGIQEIEFPLYKFWQFVDAVSNFDLPADVDEIEFLPKVFFEKLATQYAEKESELEVAKQRELELLAMIEKMIEAANCVNHWHDWGKEDEGMVVSHNAVIHLWRVAASADVAIHGGDKSQALREHEATVLEYAADCRSEFECACAETLRRMADERRKK